jgi:DNA-directed RNA polymerase, mitochondrial
MVTLAPSLSDLSPYDPSQLLLLDDTAAEPPERLLSNRIKGIQIRGNAQEVKTTMDACLQVRRFDRAFALLRQLQIILHPHSNFLREAFNDCLQAMVMDMIMNNDKKNILVIEQWVEVDMLKAGVEPDARTYALKVKVALATLTGSKRDRTVRRYWELARKGERLNEVASLRDILSEQDLGRLSEIAPQTQTDLDYDESEDYLLPVEQATGTQPEADQVRPTDQKGLGLMSLRKSMSLFSGHSHFENQAEMNSQMYARARQIRLEADSVKAAVERWRTEQKELTRQGLNRNFRSPKLGVLLWQWHQEVCRKLREELELVEVAELVQRKNDREKLRCEYGPFLRLIDPEQLAALVTLTTIGTIDKRGVQAPFRLARIVVAVGRMVEAEVQVAHKRLSVQGKKSSETGQQIHQQDVSSAATPSSASGPETSSIPTAPAYQRGIGSRLYGRPRYQWTPATHARIGAVLCEMLFDAAKLSVSKEDPASKRTVHVSQPAFTQTELFEQGRKVGVVSLHSELVEKLMHEPAGNLLAKHLPMVCEPTPWTDFDTGGFLTNQTSFLRVKGGELSQRACLRSNGQGVEFR